MYLLKSFRNIIFLCLGLALMLATIIYTALTPDIYIQAASYFLTDFAPPFTLESLMNNAYVMDIIFGIATFYNINDPYTIGFYFVIAYSLVFILKYTYVLKNTKSFASVFWLLFATFIVFDCNQMRYSLALTLLIIYIHGTKKSKFLLVLSFLSHITTIPYYLFSKRQILLPLLLFIPLVIVLSTSRYMYLFIDSEFVFYKSFLLIIPIIIYNIYSDKSISINDFINKISTKFYFVLPVVIFLVPMSAARIIETIYALLFYANCLVGCKKFPKYTMYIFAIALMASRLMGGIHSPGDDNGVLEEYRIFGN